MDTKLHLIMRYVIIIMIGFIVPVSASTFAQRITISKKNATLIQVLNEIKNQSGYDFVFKGSLKNTNLVSIAVKNEALENVLEKIFNNQPVRYEIVNKSIVIKMSRDPLNEKPISNLKLVDVQGKLVDDQGNPLIGATVKVRGTSRVFTTDSKGEFKISAARGSVLEFSYLGYKPKEVVIGDELTLTVVLEADQAQLNEIMVMGYTTQLRANVTGSVATINAEQLTTVPVANVTNALAGKLPGLLAVQRSGEPGLDASTISIRGFGSALVVIDGVVGRDFQRLDPNEIESISILKDASAAVYGVLSGNGVILVTTKRGKNGQPQFSYNMNYGVQTVTRYPEFVNAAEFAELKNEDQANKNLINKTNAALPYTPDDIEKFRTGADFAHPNTDWYDLMVKKFTPQTLHNISVRGGSERIKYYFQLGQTNQDGMWKGDNQKYAKYNLRSNVDAKVNEFLDLSLDLGGRIEKRNSPVDDSYLMSSWMQYMHPIFNAKTPDGKLNVANIFNPLAFLDENISGFDHNRRNVLEAALTLNYKIPFINGLNFKLKGAFDTYYSTRKFWQKKYDVYTWNQTTQQSVYSTSYRTNTLLQENNNWQQTNLQASLEYVKSFDQRHNLNFLILYEQNESNFEYLTASRDNYLAPIDQLFAGPSLNQQNYGDADQNGRQSILGKINYDYKGKYLFESIIRYDGSAKFAPDKRWGLFPAVTLGWRISEEGFLKNNFKAIDDMKLRLSAGKQGNDATGDFQFLAGYTFPSGGYILGNNGLYSGLVDKGIPNPDILWEKSTIYNAGLDLSLWKRNLGIEFDVFYRKRTGVLATPLALVPATFGASFAKENLNEDMNMGFELVLSHRNKIGAVNYDISSNVSLTRVKNGYIERNNPTSQWDNYRNNFESRWTNITFGYKAIGQFQSFEEIKASPLQDARQNSTLLPGDIKYEDYNLDGIIDSRDEQVIGSGQVPLVNFGTSFNFRWKAFSAGIHLQGSGWFNMIEQDYLRAPFFNSMNAYAYMTDRWRRENPSDPNSAWIPGKYPSTISNGTANNKLGSTYWVRDASYLRLKSLNFSYTLKSKHLEKIGVNAVSISVSGQNLFVISQIKHIDPETPTGRLSYYPQQKTYNFGLNVTF